MYRLVATGQDAEWVFVLPETEARIGSQSDNDLVLPVRGVSRRHALVRRVPGGVEIADQESKNGLRVERQRVLKAQLTPGLRVQIGEAWLEMQEITTTEENLVCTREALSQRSARPCPVTATVESYAVSIDYSPSDAVLSLAYHIARVGVGIPEERNDLLLRIRSTLGAEAFATFDRTRTGKLRIWESAGTFSCKDNELISSLAGRWRILCDQVSLKREGTILVAGIDSWLLVARFSCESQTHMAWRKDFLRFLTSQFFGPVRQLLDVNSFEAARVFRLARENARRTATLLEISPGRLYALLKRLGLP